MACLACVAQLEADLLDRGCSCAGLFDLERVQASDDDADIGAVFDLRDRGVTENRPLCDQLAALGAYRGDLHGHTGSEPCGQAGADLEAEQPAAEQCVFVIATRDRCAHRVDDRLREPFGALRDQHLLGAVVAKRGRKVLRDAFAHKNRVCLAAELGGELCTLGDGTQ